MEIDVERNNCWRRIPVGCAKKKTLFLLFVVTTLIYLVLNWEVTKSADFLERPHENHRIRLKPAASPSFDVLSLGPQDYKRLVDLNDFHFTLIEPEACKAPVFLLVLVPSAPNHLHKRLNIRTTWGHRRMEVKIVFVLGRVQDNNLQKDIENESEVYRDVIQGNFLDTYQNLTYKAMSAFKFVLYHCEKALYVLKMDDDCFVNMPLLLNFLKNDLSVYGTDNLFLCNDMTGSPVIRDVHSQWYVSEMDLSDEFYPSYCSGWYAILSPDVIFRLYESTQKLKYLSIDDALIYGIAAKKCNLTHTDFSRYTLAYRSLDLHFNGTYDSLPLLFGSPNMNPEQIKNCWLFFRSRPVAASLRGALGT
ncbi:beta-1,3-galactosyltransferase 5-like [Sitophilus oryzae]|uniref:Hexosyltransferase n=1 Tax=Sitophilus oryzae TaxID=7048 RepID=A0A6J2Y9K6_SITOR|nr:beta-1,3-galactosyltransferase 5-like [Sitophilus oryzae]